MAEKTTIEESLKELDAIVAKLESREISLEDSFALYQKGMELLKECSKKIDPGAKKMLKMDENGELSDFKRRAEKQNSVCGTNYPELSSERRRVFCKNGGSG